jgi:hypothetical protein
MISHTAGGSRNLRQININEMSIYFFLHKINSKLVKNKFMISEYVGHLMIHILKRRYQKDIVYYYIYS